MTRRTFFVVYAELAFSLIVVEVAQLVRALDCGSRGRGFESRLSPLNTIRGVGSGVSEAKPNRPD